MDLVTVILAGIAGKCVMKKTPIGVNTTICIYAPIVGVIIVT